MQFRITLAYNSDISRPLTKSYPNIFISQRGDLYTNQLSHACPKTSKPTRVTNIIIMCDSISIQTSDSKTLNRSS